MSARHDACPKRSECTPHACEAGGGKWPRCPVVGFDAASPNGDRACRIVASKDAAGEITIHSVELPS